MQTPGTRTKNVNNRIQDKKINAVYLKKDFDEINFDIENGKIKSDKQVRILNFVKDKEHSVLISSHILSDIEIISDKIIFIDNKKKNYTAPGLN